MANLSDTEREYKEISSLKEGATVECKECHKGHYRPFNGAKAVEAHLFVCDNCGATVRFEPVMDFDWVKLRAENAVLYNEKQVTPSRR